MLKQLLITLVMLSVLVTQAKSEDRAAAAYLAGDMARAAGILEKELAKGQARTSRYLMLGRIYVNLGHWGKAETTLRALLQTDPEHPQANQLLGRALLQQGKFEACIPLYESSIRETGRTDLRLEYAEALIGTGNETGAIRVLKRIVSEEQTIPKAHFLLGKLRLENATGRWASQHLWTAYKLGFKDAELAHMLAQSFFLEGRISGPLRLVGPLEDTAPGRRTAEVMILRPAGKHREKFWYACGTDSAIYQAESAAETIGNDQTHVLAARCWLAVGNTTAAASHLAAIKKSSPESAHLNASMVVMNENYAEFTDLMDSLQAHAVSRDAIIHLALDAAVSAQAQGHFPEALNILERADETDPGRSDLLRLVVDALTRLGREGEARQKARLLCDLHPDSPDAHLVAARFKITAENE